MMCGGMQTCPYRVFVVIRLARVVLMSVWIDTVRYWCVRVYQFTVRMWNDVVKNWSGCKSYQYQNGNREGFDVRKLEHTIPSFYSLFTK